MALSFERTIKRLCPPWLQRSVGGALMGAIGAELDGLLDRVDEGVRLRFPDAVADHAEALPLLGRQRRIRRGPGEDAATYARRLRTWWDAHRTRGGPYALLGQLYAFFLDWLNVRMDVVYHSGTRRWQDAAGVVTRDSVTWDADGTSLWAQVWVFLYVSETIPRSTAYLVTYDGDRIVQYDGGGILLEESIAPDEITPEEEEVFRAIPRDWSAAHVKTTFVVLLWGERRLWNYPQPVPTWSGWGASGALWGEPPVVLEIAG